MPLSARIRKNLYKDSVTLMRLTQAVLARPGIRQATLLMGTPANREILAAAGLEADARDEAAPATSSAAVGTSADAA